MVVPDDVHDAHPAGERVGLAGVVGGEELREQRSGERLVRLGLRVEDPVEGARLLVLGPAAPGARAADGAVAAATRDEEVG